MAVRGRGRDRAGVKKRRIRRRKEEGERTGGARTRRRVEEAASHRSPADVTRPAHSFMGEC